MEALMSEMDAQMRATPQAVQWWMNWMLFIFMVSVLFVRRQREARFALAAIVLTMPVGILVFYFSRNVHVLGIVHLLIWTPLIPVLLKIIKQGSEWSAYRIWSTLLLATIVISLVFDVRDLYLVAVGAK